MQLASGHLLPYQVYSQIIFTLPTPGCRYCIRNETYLHLPGRLPGYLIRKTGNSSITPAIKWPTMATGVSQPRREIANGVGPRLELRSS